MPNIEQPSLFDVVEEPPHALLGPNEIFERLDATLLRELGEDRRLERKPAKYQNRLVGNYISMWANTPPAGGLIVAGVRNDSSFEGLKSRGQDGLNKLEKCARIYCPAATVQTRLVHSKNRAGEQDYVLVFRVQYHPTQVVKTVSGDAFIREGDSIHKMTPEEIRQLSSDKDELSIERQPCGLKYPSAFDLTAIHSFTAKVAAQKRWADHSDEDVLQLMKLGSLEGERFVPNISCALLFAKDPRDVIPGCRIRFLRFDGEYEGTGDKWASVKDVRVDGTVPHLIVETDQVIDAQIRTFARMDANEKFYTQPEYPRAAWYEAIVNACVHRSYGNGLRNTTIFVKMFDDRLVIESPGPFPPFVTPENIYVSHNPRNPFLMDAMYYMDFVKCAHEGTRRMRAVMSEMDLPDPEFEQKQISNQLVRVTLRNNVHQRKAWVDRDVTELIGSMLARTLTEDEKRLVNFAAEHGEISVSDAQRLLNSSWPAAKKKLARLTNRGILIHDVRRHLDRDPQARYRLNRGEMG